MRLSKGRPRRAGSARHPAAGRIAATFPALVTIDIRGWEPPPPLGKPPFPGPRFRQPPSVIDLVSLWPSRDGVRVEWDPEKDRANRAKHAVSFDEVRVLFEGDAAYVVL